jgi:copper transport protein
VIGVSKPKALLLAAMLAALASLPLAATTPLAVHIHTDNAMFQVLISPGTVGSDNFVLQLMNGEGALLAVREATLTLNPSGARVAPLTRKATKGADGYWHVDDVLLPSGGRWHMRIDAVTPFQTITLEDEFDVPAQ